MKKQNSFTPLQLKQEAISIFTHSLFLFLFLFLTSCRHDMDKPRWETNIMAPIANSSLSISNLIADSLLHTNSDNSLTLVYQNTIYNLAIDTLFKMPDTTLSSSYKLSALTIGEREVTKSVTLGDMGRQNAQIGLLILLYGQGATGVGVPAITLPPTIYPINADTIFQSMTLLDGYMDITIHNGFPISMDSIIFTLNNQTNGNLIATGTFDHVPPGATQTRTVSLAGETVEGQMVATISNMQSPGAPAPPGITLDTNNAITATLRIYGVQASSATAVFPAQDLVKSTSLLPFAMNDIRLTKMIVRSGMINIDAYNTLPDTLRFTYTIPSARLNNRVFKATESIPPAPPFGSSHIHKSYDFTSYAVDLRGINQDTVNTFYFNLLGRIDSTGVVQTLTLNDSIWVQTSFSDLYPEYAKGYLGTDTQQVGPGTSPVDLFKKITSGSILLDSVRLSVSVENGIGADAIAQINNLQAVNTATGNSVTLSGSGVSTPIVIPRAVETGNPASPVTPSFTTLLLDNSNSNAKALIENLPNEFGYDLTVRINPNGNISNGNDFIYHASTLKTSLNLEIPLDFMANHLTLVDTTNFSFNSVSHPERIKNGTFTIIADNGFPFDAYLQLRLLDASGYVIDSLFANTRVDAAPVDANYYVTTPKRSKILIPVTEQKIDNLLRAKFVIISAGFTTIPDNKYIKIYSNYRLNLKLTGDFTYKVE